MLRRVESTEVVYSLIMIKALFAKLDNKTFYKWNQLLAILHGLQGILVLLFSASRTFPVTTNYLTLDELSMNAANQPVLANATRHLLDVNLAYLVAGFFFMSAVSHLILSTRYRKRYEADLKKGMNKARWIEYSFSASTMMVVIAMLAGVQDFSSLLMIFSLIAIMNLLGLAMEIHNTKAERINWTTFIIGCIAGVVPWLVIAKYLLDANLYGSGNVPTFVYFIFGSIFVFFNCFAINMYLQYRRKGKWANYLYGERTYMILSLVAKSALAWQVFAGTLRP